MSAEHGKEEVEYLRSNKVPQILDDVVRALLSARPQEPAKFMVDYLAKRQLNGHGIAIPQIMIPKDEKLMEKWAIIACDQYTSQLNYWEEVEKIVGAEPSTLRIMLPEVYLETPKENEMIANIKATMKKYIDQKIFRALRPGFVVIDRKTSLVPSRKGLVVALDLEQYDYSKDSKTLIRATEGTIVERLPPRVRVREGAMLESPHIMVLIDDPKRTVIEPLFEKKLEKVYDFELMKNGGHIKGFLVEEVEDLKQCTEALAALANPEDYAKRYNVPQTKDMMIYAMGDGNHSFATAKKHWETLKSKASPKDLVTLMETHPARYCLVELVNIHDKGLQFEPIHRVLFHTTVEALVESAKAFFPKSNVTYTSSSSVEAAKKSATEATSSTKHAMAMVTPQGAGVLAIDSVTHNLVLGTLQPFLDDFLKKKDGVKIDYIHGDEAVSELGGKPENLGIFLPPIDKGTFFRSIIVDGTLPRKCFSMGEADEKRFYLECRRIVP